jgi:hypothetical protein
LEGPGSIASHHSRSRKALLRRLTDVPEYNRRQWTNWSASSTVEQQHLYEVGLKRQRRAEGEPGHEAPTITALAVPMAWHAMVTSSGAWRFPGL